MSRKWSPRFASYWEDDPELKLWVRRVPGDDTKAMCRICKGQLRAHHDHLIRHARTKKHINGVRSLCSEEEISENSIPIPPISSFNNFHPIELPYELPTSAESSSFYFDKETSMTLNKVMKTEFMDDDSVSVEDRGCNDDQKVEFVINSQENVEKTTGFLGVFPFEELFGQPTKMLTAAKQFIEFVNKGPSPFHVVDECKTLLRAKGFKELREKETWIIENNQKYFVTRNQSTIIAFAVGGGFAPGNGFTMIGAHTDSPCLKVKPKSGKVRHGYHQVGVQLYGGGIWNTWFDRDLTVAGRVLVKEGEKVTHRLVNVKRPILRIPHLAIHLNRKINEHFGPNLENELLPIIASTVESSCVAPVGSKHAPALLDAICKNLGVEHSQLMDFELCLADTQPATIGGAMDEFIFSPRLDNLVNAYCGLLGLIESCDEQDSLSSDPNIRMVLLFDNEEVGSTSAQGAQSSFSEWILRRLSAGGSATAYEEAIAKSFLVSADQVHACHPNYADKHEDNHKVSLHKGPAIKFNANQRYATTAVSASILRVIAEKADIPLQDIVVKNDSPCGSTIGPLMSAKLGLRTVDMGSPQLSMHSIREMCCTSSISQSIKLFKAFYHMFHAVDESFMIE